MAERMLARMLFCAASLPLIVWFVPASLVFFLMLPRFMPKLGSCLAPTILCLATADCAVMPGALQCTGIKL
jgi:hypothetical protein